MSIESLSTEFSIELSHFLESAVTSDLYHVESCQANARDTNQISMRMDLINQELEDIKNSFDSSTDNATQSLQKSESNHLDRFDSIPANIKAYIRQEIQCLDEKLPHMISQIVKKEMELYFKNPINRKMSPVKTSRPPWDNDFTSEKIKMPIQETISSRLKKN